MSAKYNDIKIIHFQMTQRESGTIVIFTKIIRKTYSPHLVAVSLERNHSKEEGEAGRSLKQHL